MQQAVGYAVEHDVVIVASSGDYGDGSNGSLSPANCAGVLAVGAVGFSGPQIVAWAKTERQPYVAAAAPGRGVGGVLRGGKYYDSVSGTSQAAALTSGPQHWSDRSTPHVGAHGDAASRRLVPRRRFSW